MKNSWATDWQAKGRQDNLKPHQRGLFYSPSPIWITIIERAFVPVELITRCRARGEYRVAQKSDMMIQTLLLLAHPAISEDVGLEGDRVQGGSKTDMMIQKLLLLSHQARNELITRCGAWGRVQGGSKSDMTIQKLLLLSHQARNELITRCGAWGRVQRGSKSDMTIQRLLLFSYGTTELIRRCRAWGRVQCG